MQVEAKPIQQAIAMQHTSITNTIAANTSQQSLYSIPAIPIEIKPPAPSNPGLTYISYL